MTLLSFAWYKTSVIIPDVGVSCLALESMAERAAIQHNEPISWSGAGWYVVGSMEFRSEGGVAVGPSVEPFFTYLAFVKASYVREGLVDGVFGNEK